MNDPKDYNSGGLSRCCGAEIKNGFCSDCHDHAEPETLREKLKHIAMYHYQHKTRGTVETIPCYAVADVLALLDN